MPVEHDIELYLALRDRVDAFVGETFEAYPDDVACKPGLASGDASRMVEFPRQSLWVYDKR